MEEGSCVNLQVRAASLGHTVVTVHYRYLEVELSASVTIAAYKPLRVSYYVHPAFSLKLGSVLNSHIRQELEYFYGHLRIICSSRKTFIRSKTSTTQWRQLAKQTYKSLLYLGI